TSLGCFNYLFGDGQTNFYVGLWNSGGVLLASNNVTAGSPLLNQTRYEPISPVLLASGLTYYLGAYNPATGTTILAAAAPGSDVGGSVTTSPEIVDGTAVAHFFSFDFPESPQGGPGSAFLVPNFQFTTVPEPSSLALAIACAFFITRRSAGRRAIRP